MKRDNMCLIIVAIAAIIAIIVLIAITQRGGEPDGALSAETTCYRNFYYCLEQTDVPVEDCLDVQANCLAIGP